MAKKESLNLLNAYNFETVGDVNKDIKEKQKEVKNPVPQKKAPSENKNPKQKQEKSPKNDFLEQNKESEKKEEKKNNEHYMMLIRLPKEYEIKLKVLAAQEYRGNLTKYITQLLDEDFKKRGIK